MTEVSPENPEPTEAKVVAAPAASESPAGGEEDRQTDFGGQTVGDIRANLPFMVAEGVKSVRTVCELAEQCGVDMPIAREVDDPEACIVAILCDTGERYLSKVFNDEWLEENGMGDLVDRAPARGTATGQ